MEEYHKKQTYLQNVTTDLQDNQICTIQYVQYNTRQYYQTVQYYNTKNTIQYTRQYNITKQYNDKTIQNIEYKINVQHILTKRASFVL